MKKILFVFLILGVFFASCKKKSDDASSSGWSAEDQAIYNTMISLQKKAGENFIAWSQTMDSLEVINKLEQFFLDDPVVSQVTISSQGITVEYTNGMRGGIILNPGRSAADTANLSPPGLKSGLSPKGSDILVNNKKMIILSAAYDQFKTEADQISNSLKKFLPRVGYNLTMYKNKEVTLDKYCELSGYGVIRFDSHGLAFPDDKNIKDIYLMSGEEVNDITTKKYEADIKGKSVIIAEIKDYSNLKSGKDTYFYKNVYWISKDFITTHNTLTKDTMLIDGGFCYSGLQHWNQLTDYFYGSYVGVDWAVNSKQEASWFINMMNYLTDTLSPLAPFTLSDFMTSPYTIKSYYDTEKSRRISLLCAGDQSLTLMNKTSAKQYSSLSLSFVPAVHDDEYDEQGGVISSSDISFSFFSLTRVPCTQNGNIITASFPSPGAGTLTITLHPDHTLSYTVDYQCTTEYKTEVLNCTVNKVPYYGDAGNREIYNANLVSPLIELFAAASTFTNGHYDVYELIQSTKYDYGTGISLYY